MKYAADTLGLHGTYTDPLWQVTVSLSALERDLLRCWWLRRLQFIAHAGAAALVTTQTYSRLEHSLGVLALVAHFHPEDAVARAAALVHDIGHLPFSHTVEGLAGLDHHQLGRQRLEALAPVLHRHGLDVEQVTANAHGADAGPLAAGHGHLTLDHLDSFVRSGRAHGRFPGHLNDPHHPNRPEQPHELLSRLSLQDGAVTTDAATADVLAELAIAEARSQTAPVNVLATGLVRHWAGTLLRTASASQRASIAAGTDEEFWALLRGDERTRADVEQFRRDPLTWTVTTDDTDATDACAYTTHQIRRLYLTLPRVQNPGTGQPVDAFTDLPPVPLHFTITRTTPPGPPA